MDILELTRELIHAQIVQRNVTAASLDGWLKTTHDTLLKLWQRECNQPARPIRNAMGWKDSIRRSENTLCGSLRAMCTGNVHVCSKP